MVAGLVQCNDGITRADRERARALRHRVVDEQRLRILTRLRQQRRGRDWFPVFLNIVMRLIKAVHDDYVYHERGVLEVLLRVTCYKVVHWFGLAASFGRAHLGGWVSRDTWRYRRDLCDGCSLREQVGRFDYCTGLRGGQGCGCSRRPWWRPGTLDYRLWLAAFACPIDRFGPADRWRTWLRLLAGLILLGGLLAGLAHVVA